MSFLDKAANLRLYYFGKEHGTSPFTTDKCYTLSGYDSILRLVTARDRVLQYWGLLGTYSEEVKKMSNTVLSECGTLKKDMSLSPKIIRRKILNLLKLRSTLATSLTTHDFALIEKTVNEAFVIVEQRYGSMGELGI